MRKKSLILSLIAVAIIMAVSLTACGGETNVGTNDGSASGGQTNVPTSDVDVTSMIYSITQNGNNVDPTKNFEIGKEYIFNLTFNVSSKVDLQETKEFTTNFVINNMDVVESSFLNANTGNTDEMPWTDSDSGTIGKKSTLTFKLFKNKDEDRMVEFNMKLTPVLKGNALIKVTLSGSGLEFVGAGADGISIGINVGDTILSTPQVTAVNNVISWNKVPNAEFYDVYVDDVLYETIPASSAGTKMEFVINKSGVSEVKVRAKSSDANFITSDFSNKVIIGG